MSSPENKTTKGRRILRIVIKSILGTVIGLLLLFLLIIGLIQVPGIQNYLKKKIVTSLSEKLQTDVRLRYIRINLAGNLVLGDLYLADRQNDTIINAGKLRVSVNPTGLLKKRIIISEILLSKSTFNYQILDSAGKTNLDFIINSFGGQTKEEPKSAEPWDIQIKRVRLLATSFNYNNLADSMLMKLKVGHLNVRVDKSRLDSMLFDVKSILLENTRVDLVSYALVPIAKVVEEQIETEKESSPISISLQALHLKNISFHQADSFTRGGGVYKIGEARIVPKSIDLENQEIEISSIEIEHGNIRFVNASQEIQTTEKETVNSAEAGSAWQIKLLRSNIQFDHIQLLDIVPSEGSLSYLSDISLSNLKADFSGSFAGSSWQGNINKLLFEDNRTSQLVKIMAHASSNGQAIKVNPFRINIGNSYINGNAQTKTGGTPGQMPDFSAEVTSSDFVVSDFAPYLPQTMIASLERMPDRFQFTTDISSKNQFIRGAGELTSGYGNVSFTSEMSNLNTLPAYKINVKLLDINAGFFAQNQQLGLVTADIKADGQGFKPDSMLATLKMNISSIVLQGKTYKNLDLSGNINYGALEAKIASPDKRANLYASVKGNLNDNSFAVNSHINNLDLYAMGLIKDTIAISGIIDAKYKIQKEGSMAAYTDTLQLTVTTPRNDIITDSKLRYTVTGDSVHAFVGSNFGDIAYDGNVALQNIPVLMKNYFAKYFSAQYADSVSGNEHFDVAVNIRDLSILKDLYAMNISVPEEARIKAAFKEKHFTTNISFDKLIYNTIEIDKLSLEANGKDSSFRVDFKTAAVSNESQTLKEILLESDLREGILDSRLSFSDAESEKWFDIGAEFQPQNPALNVVIKEPLLLNHVSWNVDDKNRTFIQNNNIVFKDVKLTSGDKLISLLSDAQYPEKLAVVFKNMNLALLSEMTHNDTTSITGSFDGNLKLTNLMAKPFPVFDIKLDVNDIVVENHKLGNLNILAANTRSTNIADLDVNFGEQNMRFNLNGSYGLNEDIPMDLKLNAENLDLSAIKPLIKDIITNASGIVNASLNLKGSFSKPDIAGQIGFDKATAFVVPAQTQFTIDQQKILFRGNKILFNKFTVKDAENRNLAINGDISLADLNNLSYNLNIQSQKFLAYQGPPDKLPGQDNKVIITSNIQIEGKNNIPVVKATLNIDEGSKFFYKITKHATTITEEGVIEFASAPNVEEEEKEQAPSAMENLNLTANITIDENTAIRVVTDPVRNLGLNMVAGGKFSMSQRPYQSPQLIGRLDISGGDYSMNFSGVRKIKFNIADSSYINWYGSISEPELNLRAYYEVKTSTAGLISEDTDQPLVLPFMVFMNISGSLANPTFSFELSLPSEYEGVNNGQVAAKLQEINSNETELNQTAMSLILFGTFGFDNIAGIVTSGRAGTNAVISNALNQFVGQKVKFVDLHFELESYDNYGGTSDDNLRTEMKIAAAKKLADDRLNVELGATAVLQADEIEQQQSALDKISPEFNIGYLLNEPRTLSVRAFRSSEYRGLVEGKVISTGIGLIFQKDFNKLSDLFAKKPKEVEDMADNQNAGNEK